MSKFSFIIPHIVLFYRSQVTGGCIHVHDNNVSCVRVQAYCKNIRTLSNSTSTPPLKVIKDQKTKTFKTCFLATESNSDASLSPDDSDNWLPNLDGSYDSKDELFPKLGESPGNGEPSLLSDGSDSSGTNSDTEVTFLRRRYSKTLHRKSACHRTVKPSGKTVCVKKHDSKSGSGSPNWVSKEGRSERSEGHDTDSNNNDDSKTGEKTSECKLSKISSRLDELLKTVPSRKQKANDQSERENATLKSEKNRTCPLQDPYSDVLVGSKTEHQQNLCDAAKNEGTLEMGCVRCQSESENGLVCCSSISSRSKRKFHSDLVRFARRIKPQIDEFVAQHKLDLTRRPFARDLGHMDQFAHDHPELYSRAVARLKLPDADLSALNDFLCKRYREQLICSAKEDSAPLPPYVMMQRLEDIVDFVIASYQE